MAALQYDRAWTVAGPDEYLPVVKAMIGILQNNVASGEHELLGTSGRRSMPGCIIASPSFPSRPPRSTDVTDQDYVFNWVRDSAISALELSFWPDVPAQTFGNYVRFCRATQTAGASIGFACYRVDATPRDGTDPIELKWSEQSDGPALRIRSVLQIWPKLDEAAKQVGRNVVLEDVTYLLNAYRLPTRNLWEESVGFSFFVRAVQVQAFSELLDVADPAIADALNRAALTTAIDELRRRLGEHWNSGAARYDAILDASDPRGAGLDAGTLMAAVYGAAAVDDPRMMATFFQLSSYFSGEYKINQDDRHLALGPMIGRYPGDIYDGDWAEPNIGHPWALCTCNGAEYLYLFAATLRRSGSIMIDQINAQFFQSMGIQAGLNIEDAIGKLIEAGDRMLDAVLRHADQLHLSEQFDRDTGFEKSVRDLSWSYASFCSAVRARQRSYGDH